MLHNRHAITLVYYVTLFIDTQFLVHLANPKFLRKANKKKHLARVSTYF